jgi:D-xylose transport system ATP-binding protein
MDTQTQTTNKPVLELRGISKRFGGITALKDVSFELRSDEIVALVGDNGAGKSTLIKAIAGSQPADEGEFLFDGLPVQINTPVAARNLGIETVYQDLAMCDNLDTVQNLFLGQELSAGFLGGARLKKAAMEKRAREVLKDFQVTTIRSLQTPAGRLSGGQRQAIAICRCMLRNPKVVLLDEPTAALGVAQRQQVIMLLRRLRSERRSIIVISHDLNDLVLEVADRIVVLRLGQKVAEFTRAEADASKVIAAITGIDKGKQT